MPKRPRILVVNDDGIDGEGLMPLVSALGEAGSVTAVVPERERSTVSHGLTLHKPLRLRRVRGGLFTLNGTPADCVRLGVIRLMRGRADLVASGINRGHNLGQDVVYSGTVGAAAEAALLEVPALAISQGVREGGDYLAAAGFALRLSLQVLRRGLPRGTCINVNVPPIPAARIRGAMPARLGRRAYDKTVTERADPRGRAYFWIAGRHIERIAARGTDLAAIKAGYISVTPLRIDNTDEKLLRGIKRWGL
ncbi:MAG: 5'/3'-nucleotidase SurE [Elusimicrobiota bacterium]